MEEEFSSILHKFTACGDDTNNKLLGASFVVVNEEGILYSGAAGRIDFPQGSKPWATDSFSWIASMTKIVTATCLLQLVECGKVKLEDDMRDIVPHLAAMQILRGFDAEEKPILEVNDAPITLRMLMTHTVGLGYDLADPDLMKWSASIGRTATNLDWSLEGFNTPFKFKPGEGWYYGTAMDWAGQALEKITGQTIGAYMSEHIFEPFGMHDTGFWPEKLPQVSDRAVTSSVRGDDKVSLNSGPALTVKDHEVESGGAGLFTTIDDYGKFFQALLGNKLLTKETMDEMFAPQLNETQAGMLMVIAGNFHDMFAVEFPKDIALNHGLGGLINMADVPGKRRGGSLTWSGMCNGHWWIDRQSGIAAAFLVNITPHGDPVVARLYNELEELVYKELV